MECKCFLYLVQVNCVFLAITLKVLLVAERKKSIRENVASNKDRAKCVYMCIYICTYIILLVS